MILFVTTVIVIIVCLAFYMGRIALVDIITGFNESSICKYVHDHYGRGKGLILFLVFSTFPINIPLYVQKLQWFWNKNPFLMLFAKHAFSIGGAKQVKIALSDHIWSNFF